ncbi:MFS transporter [Bradyrhizobium vignae]|uniref:MFS transporter n=1 Tax=Bradyrhizobium vignae TaxID=1549949 RepID=UPI00100B4510|nr:MFS transporter [Bradyrhizobium vignae]RXH05168.1 MFS transporter [Bradyrhizobium vignae]
MSPLSPHGATAEAVLPSMWPALGLGLAAFLTNFDVTAVVVALPAIARELQLDIAGYAWVMDAFSLAFTASLLVAGALADRYGRRAAMLWGNLIFAVASIACASAWNGMSLNLARAFQGIGAAFVITGGIALIASAYPQAKARTRAFAWLGVMSGTAMALGPALGGIVSSWLGWRWIFLANVPACVLVAWGIPHLVGEAKEPSPRPLDFVGMVILTAALFVLIEALLYGRTARMTLVVGCGLALVLFFVFALQQRRRAQPIFDPVVFLRPAMVGIAVLLAAVSIGYWAMLVYLPPFLSASLGVSADTGGIVMLAATLPMLFVPPLGGRIVTALGWRWYFTLALAIMTIGSAGFVAALTANGTPNQWPVILAMIVVGLGAALAHPQLSGVVVALVPSEQAGMASAVTIVMRQAGFAVGIAAFGALLSSSDRAVAYFWPFVGTGLACALGTLAAVILLPPRLPER